MLLARPCNTELLGHTKKTPKSWACQPLISEHHAARTRPRSQPLALRGGRGGWPLRPSPAPSGVSAGPAPGSSRSLLVSRRPSSWPGSRTTPRRAPAPPPQRARRSCQTPHSSMPRPRARPIPPFSRAHPSFLGAGVQLSANLHRPSFSIFVASGCTVGTFTAAGGLRMPREVRLALAPPSTATARAVAHPPACWHAQMGGWRQRQQRAQGARNPAPRLPHAFLHPSRRPGQQADDWRRRRLTRCAPAHPPRHSPARPPARLGPRRRRALAMRAAACRAAPAPAHAVPPGNRPAASPSPRPRPAACPAPRPHFHRRRSPGTLPSIA